MSFKKAVKEQSKLRLGLLGLAGSGKTYSALAIAHVISQQMRAAGHGSGKIAVIDSERGSASLYADKFEFDVCELESFSPLAYVDRIKEAEGLGYDIIIADSLSHAWAGKDGALEQKDKAADRDPRGNSWTAWRNVTPKHTALVDALVGSKAHVIATMRQKMEHVQETVNGKTEIKKVGLAAIQREGMEYEFTLVGDLDLNHCLKISKTRVDGIDIGDMFEKPGEVFAKRVYGWLMSGAAPRPREEPSPAPATPPVAPISTPISAAVDAAFKAFITGIEVAQTQAELDLAVCAPGKPAKGTPEHKRAGEAWEKRQAWLKEQAKAQAQGAA